MPCIDGCCLLVPDAERCVGCGWMLRAGLCDPQRKHCYGLVKKRFGIEDEE